MQKISNLSEPTRSLNHVTTAVRDRRPEVTTVVREIIASIKEVDIATIEDDAPLFREGLGEPPAVELDSLDALDLSLELKDRFDPHGDVLDSFFRDNPDPEVFGTVNKIANFILWSLPDVEGVQSLPNHVNPVLSQRGNST
jgi:acyl carrier protein